MALDEALLESAASGEVACLRFYGWEPATLSLGYFQRFGQRRQHTASRECPLVRRATGGGAILHDREVTYSFAVSMAHPAAVRAERLYQAFHETLVQVLAPLGVDARLCREGDLNSDSGDEPFLCFQRRSVGDVLLAGAKIAGSAQRRRQRAVLQHGSVLLSRSPYAPELPGIEELIGFPVGATLLIQSWSRALAERLDLDLMPDGAQPSELAAAQSHASARFAARSWNEKR
jgi:lipoate-protein ligase A